MKKFTVWALAIIMALGVMIPVAFAASNNGNGNQKVANEYDEYTNSDYNNAQFHCNTCGGNGRVWLTMGKDLSQKWSKPLKFKKIPGTTSWELLDKTTFVCDRCGSTEWVTFSNNSGVPDGKNIQMQHPGGEILIEKEWIKHNESYGAIKFFADFKLTFPANKDFKGGSMTVSPGKHFLAGDLAVTVQEAGCTKGFELVDMLLNGVSLGADIVSGVKAGDKVKAVNEDKPPLKFVKYINGESFQLWAELNNNTGYSAAEIAAMITFEIYKADGIGDKDFSPGKLFAKAGVNADGSVSFCPDKAWNTGWYAIIEKLTPAGAALFAAPEPLYVYIELFNGIPTITNSAGGKIVSENEAFDYGAFYTIINGYGGGYVLGYPGLNNTGDIFPIAVRNADGDSTEYGKTYPSFCANAGSRAFAGESGMGCEGYYVAENLENFADFIAAYNYIEDKVGDLNDFRAITQIVTWILLGAIEMPSEAFDNINWAAVETGTWAVKGIPGAKAIVEAVIANYKNFKGNKKVVNVVFMACEQGHGYKDCQPQLVPVYGKLKFENTLKILGKVSFNKVKYGGAFPVGAGEFGFELFKIVGGDEVYVGTYYNDGAGKVSAEGLASGNYVFREVLTADLNFDGMALDVSYRPVWKAIYPNGGNGLYFEIPAGGGTVWPDGYALDKAGSPTVNNEYYCKHSYLWTVTKETEDSVPFGGGWIRFDLGHDETYKASYREANCCDGAGWLMLCDICGQINGGFYVADEANPATGHKYSYEPVHPMWCNTETAGTLYRRCDNCDFSDQIFDYNLWYQLLLGAGINPADWGFLPAD